MGTIQKLTMQKPPVIAISGVKNSGKTTLLEKILPILNAKGLNVAVIKHDGHTFDADVEGTDSYRMRKAGAYGTAVFCDTHFMVIKSEPTTSEALLSCFSDADLILCEGLKNSRYPKIEVVRKGNSNAPVCDPQTLLAVATDQPLDLSVPTVDLNNPQKIAELIEQYLQDQTTNYPKIYKLLGNIDEKEGSHTA